jgi:hypothetical protein
MIRYGAALSLLLLLAGCVAPGAVSLPSPAAVTTPAAAGAVTTTPAEPFLTPAPPVGLTPAPVSPTPNPTPPGPAGSPAAWRVYSSQTWHLTLEYPGNWTVREASEGTTFASPAGATIQLAPVDTAGRSPDQYLRDNDLPNTRCTLQTNAYGVKERTCLDTIAGSRLVMFLVPWPDGSTRLFALQAGRRSDASTLEQMADTIRPAS